MHSCQSKLFCKNILYSILQEGSDLVDLTTSGFTFTWYMFETSFPKSSGLSASNYKHQRGIVYISLRNYSSGGSTESNKGILLPTFECRTFPPSFHISNTGYLSLCMKPSSLFYGHSAHFCAAAQLIASPASGFFLSQ